MPVNRQTQNKRKRGEIVVSLSQFGSCDFCAFINSNSYANNNDNKAVVAPPTTTTDICFTTKKSEVVDNVMYANVAK